MAPSLIVLGSGTAVQTAQRDNTALAFQFDGAAVLVDCPGSPMQKLLRAGIDPMQLAAVVVTHTHPDHVYGLPSLIHSLWIMGRTTPLPVFAPAAEVERVHRLLDLFDLDRRAAFVDVRPLPDDAAAPFWEQDGHRLFALPVDHGRPTSAVRWDLRGGGRVVYSSDTTPAKALASFAAGATILVHEATFADADAARAAQSRHSTAGQAGGIAALTAARRLLLVHVTIDADPKRWVAEARAQYGGPVEVPADGSIYALG